MSVTGYLGIVAAFCTTVAFVPQIVKLRKQGGKDLSYPMLFLYMAGVLLWLVYGIQVHAAGETVVTERQIAAVPSGDRPVLVTIYRLEPPSQ